MNVALHRAVIIAVVMSTALVTSLSAKADTLSYQIDFDKSSGPTIANGSFQFDSLGAVGKITDADFANLQAMVDKVLFIATSASDDFARVTKQGVVKGLFADLEPADNPMGDVLQLYAGKHHHYKLFDPTMTEVVGKGTYELETVKASVPEPSTFFLLSLGLAALAATKKRTKFV